MINHRLHSAEEGPGPKGTRFRLIIAGEHHHVTSCSSGSNHHITLDAMRTPFTISATARETTFFNQATGVERLQPRAMEEATTSTRRASAMTVEQRRARRAELRQFYGMKGDTAGQMGDNAPGASKSDNPLDIGKYHDVPLTLGTAAHSRLAAVQRGCVL